MADTPQESAMKAESEKPRPFGTGYKLIGKDYSTNDLVAKVTGTVEVCRGFSRRGNAVLPAGAEPHAARAGEEHRRRERRWRCRE